MGSFATFVTFSMYAYNGPDFLRNSETYKNKKFENIENVFDIIHKKSKEHSEEILNVECLEYSLFFMDEVHIGECPVINWAKAKACVCTDSVLCVGHAKDIPGAVHK